MFQYSFSLCLVAFFSAILWPVCRFSLCALLFAFESWFQFLLLSGVGSFQPLNGQMRDIKQFALASFFRSRCRLRVLCWLLFCYIYVYIYFFLVFFSSTRQSILLLYVFPFSCRPSGLVTLFVPIHGHELGHGQGHAKCSVYPFGAMSWHGFGRDLCSVVGCFYLPFGCVCLHGKCPFVPLSVRPFVCPVYVIAHISSPTPTQLRLPCVSPRRWSYNICTHFGDATGARWPKIWAGSQLIYTRNWQLIRILFIFIQLPRGAPQKVTLMNRM